MAIMHYSDGYWWDCGGFLWGCWDAIQDMQTQQGKVQSRRCAVFNSISISSCHAGMYTLQRYNNVVTSCYLITGGSNLSRLTVCCDTSITMQAQDSAYKSTWRSAPSSQSGHGMAILSSKAASMIEGQKVSKGPLDQRLLQEDVIRRSGISGPLGMGVVMQSEYSKVKLQEAD